jgi:hypothetical protein
MCYFEQTQYLACGHNVEMVTEKCELGEKYRTSMHDKIITALHTEDGQCEKCNPPPAYTANVNGMTSDTADVTFPTTANAPSSTKSNNATPSIPEVAPVHDPDLIDLTDDSPPKKRSFKKRGSKQRPTPKRRDSIGEDLMDFS